MGHCRGPAPTPEPSPPIVWTVGCNGNEIIRYAYLDGTSGKILILLLKECYYFLLNFTQFKQVQIYSNTIFFAY